ncbi:MAG: cysteine synthase [Haloquadratum sp. J07HQX50]|jgi:cysteine synthase (EC 2.5.1.47)|nr:MAG: cysteine synthase [Haloquadratum sp. J07HQX50]
MDANILETIGSPLVQVTSPPGVVIAAKIESNNPGGSAKDRPALAMIEQAERQNQISPGDSLVEPTSGNTGIGLAVAAATKGYDLTVVMPASQSPERRQLMRAYGADVELVDGNISDAKSRADKLEETGMTQLRQFENPANPRAHYLTTGEEVLTQVGNRSVVALVAGVGTGGTITGVGRRLREEFPDMDIIAVEPEENAVLSGDDPGDDAFQGMGPGFVSENLDTEIIDTVKTVSIDDAEAECRRLAREEGILVGQSSGASNLVARQVGPKYASEADDCARRAPAPVIERESPTPSVDKRCPVIITVYWDSGERYMSTGLFE